VIPGSPAMETARRRLAVYLLPLQLVLHRINPSAEYLLPNGFPPAKSGIQGIAPYFPNSPGGG